MIPATDDELFCVRYDPKHCNVKQARRALYNLGLEHGKQQATEDRAPWPTPITHRPPTQEDGDRHGFVQFYDQSIGRWDYTDWQAAAINGKPWQHTPAWRPRPPTPKEQALAILDGKHTALLNAMETDVIRRALETAA
jgi:hypothetical protein